MSASHFGARLRELREQAGLTQAQLAERSGLHPQGVVKLERGEREPAWATVLALAEALGKSCEEFKQAPLSPAPEPKRGRPARAKDAAAEKPKRGRGRPKKT